ncbi:MCE family protein [Candidatus Saganbacteria bacterium]|nr:MCE family protein [Candidatus Saganbacteria bacterium]
MKLSTAAKVGIMTLIGVIALAMIITWKSNLFLIAEGIELVGSFPNIEGLTIGSEVRYRGFTVGKVMRIDPGPSDIKVYATVKRGLKMPLDSTLRVGFDGIVGLKYLEIKPGSLEALYRSGTVMQGISTAGLVDFVDVGTQSLKETKAILEEFRRFVSNPELQEAINNTATNTEKLTYELRETNAGIAKITTDPKFQESVKGTVAETNKTLASANRFFEGFGKLNIKPSGDVQYGSSANSIRANVDVAQSEADYLRIGIGEGPTRNLSLLDVLLSRRILQSFGFKLGMINTFLGGGLDLYANPNWILSGDIYDFNNPKPAVPKIRVTSASEITDYTSILLQADDIFNSGRNYSFGLRIQGGK